jgi:hypothetical protein
MKMAQTKGGFTNIIGYEKKDIEKEFSRNNRTILEQGRGSGYWLWKPYFIKRTLENINFDDYLFYSDSGAFFLKSVDILIEAMNNHEQDIMGFDLPLVEKQWTKKELFVNMDCTSDIYTNSNQILASYFLVKKTKFSIDFFEDFLRYSCNEINITDKFDSAFKQDSLFLEHRHDQSIFSLLYKQKNLKTFKDPSQFGEWPTGYAGEMVLNLEKNKLYKLSNGRLFRQNEHDEKYKDIIFHSRRSNPLAAYFKFKLKKMVTENFIYKKLLAAG